jgi:Domain of unknown function (DUF5666)
MRLRVLAGALATTAVLAAGCGAGTTPSPAAPSASPSPAPQVSGHAERRGVRGTITAEDGSTWTVTNAANRQFIVTVNPQTAFGTRTAPASAQEFPVGTQVRVVGTISGSTVTATRIVAADAAKPQAPATTAPATPAAVTT